MPLMPYSPILPHIRPAIDEPGPARIKFRMSEILREHPHLKPKSDYPRDPFKPMPCLGHELGFLLDRLRALKKEGWP